MKKLIATDIDGTLIDSKNRVTDETVHWIKRAKDAGYAITLLSARAYPLMKPVMDRLGLDECYAAANSGCDIRRYPGGEVLHADCLTAEQTAEIQRFADRHGVYVQAVRLDGSYFYSRRTDFTKFYEDYFHYTGTEADVTKLDFEDIGKCMLFMEPERTDKLTEAFNKELAGTGLRSARIWPTIVDIYPAGADKGSAVTTLAGILGIRKEDIVSFGDELVDVPMFRASGTGVAMGNAAEEVKASADFVTLTNGENGVAHYIKEVLLKEQQGD